MSIKVGLDILLDERPINLKGRRIGLLSNHASINSRGILAKDILHKTFPQELKILFSPQHGFFGEKQANMISSEDQIDKATGLPVISLYGPRFCPGKQHLKEIDLLLIDLQDVGCRVYTYIWTLFLVLKSCSNTDIEVVILDRPNPLGFYKEGPILESELFSFVGMASLPLRHGLTIGELALFFIQEEGWDLKIKVIPVHGWKGELFREIDFPWILPSPNMPSFSTALVYPGQVLLEGTNLSEGRGTTRPFEIFGAPFLKTHVLKEKISSLKGAILRELKFIPTFDKWSGKVCHGFQIHIENPYIFQPVWTSLYLLYHIITWHKEFSWRLPPYEFEWKSLPFDIIVGTKKIRQALEAKASLEEIKALCYKGLNDFEEKIEAIILYPRDAYA